MRRLVLALLLLASFGTVASAADPATDAALMRRLLERWSRERSVLVDPSFADRLAGSIATFRTNFCYSGAPTEVREACEGLLKDESRAYGVLKKYLDAALRPNTGEVTTFFQLLSVAVGSDGARTGWPPMETPPLQIFAVPAELRSSLVVVAERGRIAAPHAVTRLAMPPGSYTLIVGDRQHRLTLQAGKLAKLEAIAGIPASSPASSRFGVAWDLTCVNEPNVTVDGELIENVGRDVQLQKAAEFVNAVGVRIAIDAPPALCDDSCLLALRTDVLDAVAFWRAACSRCPNDYLAAVLVDGELFLDERILRPTSAPSYVAFGRRPLAQFIRVGLDSPEYQAIISGKGELLKMPAAVRPSLDVSELPKFIAGGKAPEMHIVVGGRPARCGGGKENVACASAGSTVELNASDYTFVEGTAKLFGGGQPRVRLLTVLVHEIGHWFGLPHVDDLIATGAERHAIMETEYVGEGQCITTGELKLLDEITDAASSRRLLVCTGFRYRQRTVSSVPSPR